jgi:cytochrome P450
MSAFSYSPFSYAIQEDPYPTYRRLREEAPCYHNREIGFWALSRFDDVWDATLDWQTFSSSAGPSIERPLQPGDTSMSFIAMDPPRQTRFRNLVSGRFTPRAIAGLEREVRRIARRHLDRLEAGRCDLLQEFAAKLPMDVISAMLGIPEGTRDDVRIWANDVLERDPDDPRPPARALAAMARLDACLRQLVEARRAEPQADLISDLLAGQVEDGPRRRPLSEREILAYLQLLSAAGNETTTKLIGNAIVLLARHPEQRERVWKEPERIPGAIEEVLRYEAPSQYQGRITLRDTEWHGQTIPKGQRVILLTGAACRDEREFERPDAFDVNRSPERQLYFGYGQHICIGKSLARLEARVALEEIAQRFPHYQVIETGLVRTHQSHVRGYAHVPIDTGGRT